MFVTEYFDFNEEQIERFDEMGVFDALLDKDSNFFINVIRLKKSETPEFAEAYQTLNAFFSEIATLLDAADSPTTTDKMYRAAKNKFKFHEVNGINLGFASSRYGAGWGEKIANQVLYDAYQIIKKGSRQPEIFHLVSLFEDNVAGDRLSDMIATIIKPQITAYTHRVMAEFGITKEHYPKLQFLSDGLVKNPYKKTPIFLLPKEILHELPIARDWDDIDRVVTENRAIREEINAEICSEWKHWAATDKKHYIKQHVFMEPDVCDRVITKYRKEDLSALNLKENPDYFAEFLMAKIRQIFDFLAKKKDITSFEASQEVIGIFKDWVENNRGWALIQDASSKNREKAVQRLVHLSAKQYIETNNFDFSCEPDEGRGPADIKISRGTDKTITEIKLSSNAQYLHGYQQQIEEYGRAEKTRNLMYVFVDLGNPGRVKKLNTLHVKNKLAGNPCPELIIVDAKPKKAASTYGADDELNNISAALDMSLCFDTSEIENVDFSDIDWEI